MKPPPPMLPALGCVTASANAVATAASTASPPLARTAAPASHAGDEVHTTSPSFDETPSSGAVRTADPDVAANSTQKSANFFSIETAYSRPVRPKRGRVSLASLGYGSCESSTADGDLA